MQPLLLVLLRKVRMSPVKRAYCTKIFTVAPIGVVYCQRGGYDMVIIPVMMNSDVILHVIHSDFSQFT